MDYIKGGHTVEMPTVATAEAIPMAQSSAFTNSQVGDAKEYEKGTFVSLPSTAVQAIPPTITSGGDAQDYGKGTFVDMNAPTAAVQVVPSLAGNHKSLPPGSLKPPPPGSFNRPPPGTLKKRPPPISTAPFPKNPPSAAATAEAEGGSTIVRSNNKDGVNFKSVAAAPSPVKNASASAMMSEDEDMAAMKMDKYAHNAQVQMLSVGEDIESPPRETVMEKKKSSTSTLAPPPENSDKQRMLKIMAVFLCLVLIAAAVVIVVVVLVLGRWWR